MNPIKTYVSKKDYRRSLGQLTLFSGAQADYYLDTYAYKEPVHNLFVVFSRVTGIREPNIYAYIQISHFKTFVELEESSYYEKGVIGNKQYSDVTLIGSPFAQDRLITARLKMYSLEKTIF
jgi:hypothetical protein